MTPITECPACHKRDSLIIDSRKNLKEQSFVKRRRECQCCGQRWTTIELPLETGQKLIKAIKVLKEIDL